MKIRTRFAPSPTGFMHIGNLRTALYAYLYAKHNDGTYILRIEDTDQERFVEGAIDVIYKTLDTAGIIYDEGPEKDGGFGPYIQSQRKNEYLEYAHKLVELGGAYYCFCKKERLDSLADEKGVKKYDKHCTKYSIEEARAKIEAGEEYVIRQNIPAIGESSYEDLVYGKISVNYEDLEDGILIKSDGMPTYNFANVIDDHLMNINTVIRGTEYLSSTPKYNLMYDSFGWDRPTYMHLPPIMKDAKRKLSKRFGDANFDDFVKKGYLPKAIINYIALLGWSPKDNQEKLSLEDLIRLFNVDGVSKSNSIFDEAKMKWLNSEYIKELPFDEFYELSIPYFEQSVAKDRYDYKTFAKLLHNRVEILSEIVDKVKFVDDFKDYDINLYNHKRMKTTPELALEYLEEVQKVLVNQEDWSNDSLNDCFGQLAEKLELKKGKILWSVRIALTGQQNTPGGATEMGNLFGKEESLQRLEYSINYLKEKLN